MASQKHIELFRGTSIVFDIETNGTAKDADILSVGYIIYNYLTDEVVSANVLYFWHNSFKTAGPTEIHGLTEEFLREQCPDIETFANNLRKLVMLIYSKDTVTYNGNSFDYPRLTAFITRFTKNKYYWCEEAIEDISSVDMYTTNIIPKGRTNRKVNLAEAYRQVIVESKDTTVVECREAVNNALVEANVDPVNNSHHDALFDCIMTLHLYRYYVERQSIRKTLENIQAEKYAKTLEEFIKEEIFEDGI